MKKTTEKKETSASNNAYTLDEDEYGYVTPGESASRELLSQLPSRHLDEDSDNDENDKTGELHRRSAVSQFRTLKLKNAALISRNVKIGAQKIYEVLNSDPYSNDEAKLQTLREMNQSLTIKRQVKEKLDAERKRNIIQGTISIFTRIKLGILMWGQKFLYELRNMCYYLEPWHSSIKHIQGQFGSGVASHFIFLRWLLYINICNFLISFFFLVIPQFTVTRTQQSNSTDDNTFYLHNILTGSGWFTDSLLYFGHYSGYIIHASSIPYNMPLAYLITCIVISLINLVIVSVSITSSYRRNYIDSAGESKNVFCNKIFSAWDFSIETESAADLQRHAFCVDMKELLHMNKQDFEITKSQNVTKRTLYFLVAILSWASICGVGYLINYLLEKRALQVNLKILQDLTLSMTVTVISCTCYFLLNNLTKLQRYISRKTKLYQTMIRVVALRAVMLGIIVYFWMIVYVPPRTLKVCYETELGKELYRLILMHFLVKIIVVVLIGELGRKLIATYLLPSIKLPTFDVANSTLDLIYFQSLVWMAILCFPFASLMNIGILVVLFYIEKASVTYNCRPPKSSWSVHEAKTCYLILTFVMFFLACLCSGYFIFGFESSECGPFQYYKYPGDIITVAFSTGTSTFTDVVKYITSPGVLFTIFCALCLLVYHMRAQATAHTSVIKKVREQLILASKDKVFLLKLFEDAVQARSTHASSSNNNKESTKRHMNSDPNIILNENFVDYTRQTDHPLQSPISRKMIPPYMQANVSANSPRASPQRNVSQQSPMSPVNYSPHQMRRGSPFPVHQPGFRHFKE